MSFDECHGSFRQVRSALSRLPSPVFLPREEKIASPRGMPFSLALSRQTLLTLPPYFLLSLLLGKLWIMDFEF